MKKIVYISSDWIFDTDMTILRHLVDEYQVFWFVLTDRSQPRVPFKDLKKYAENNGIWCRIIDCRIKELSPRKLLFYYSLAKEIRSIKPDLIVKVLQNFYWDIIGKLFLRIKTVWCIHDVEVHSGTHNGWLRQLFTNVTVKYNKNFIVFSKEQLNKFNKKYPGKNVCHIPMSIKDMGFAKENVPPIADGIKLLYFGRIEYHKGLDLLINALEECFDYGLDNISLNICGKGSYWDTCKSFIRHEDRFNLNIRYIPNEEIPNLMSSHHFLVLPYRDTTQSGPLMIAANYSLPLFASNLSSFKEIYDDKAAIYYDNIQDGITELSKISQKQYDEIRNFCKRLPITYGEIEISKKYISFFNELMTR